MNRFLEFATAHPWLITATALAAVIAIVLEIRHRSRGSAAVGPTEAVLLANQGGLLLDVRTDDEFAKGHIIDARHIRGSDLESSLEALKKYKDKPVIAYCETGTTSAAAARLLKAKGFAKVVNLKGGLQAWKQENLPVVKDNGKGGGRSAAAKGEKGAKST